MSDQKRTIVIAGQPYQVPADATQADIEQALAHTDSASQSTVPAQGAPFNAPRITQGRGTSYDPNANYLPQAGVKLRQAAPMLAALASVPLTSGMSIPMAATVTGAVTAAGQGVKDSTYEMSPSDRLANMVKVGLANAAGSTVMGAIGESATKAKDLARSIWIKAAKVPESILAETQAMKAGQGPVAGAHEVADTLLSKGYGTISQANSEAIKNEMAQLDSQIRTIINPSTKTVPRDKLLRALFDANDRIRTHIGSIDAETSAAIDRAFDRILKGPANIPIQEAQRAKEAIYAARSYVADAKASADATVDKISGRTLRNEIADAEPGVAHPNAELSRLIPASSAMDRAAFKGANKDLIDLTTSVLAGVNNVAGAASFLSKNPSTSTFIAQRIYNLAEGLPAKSRNAETLLRLIRPTIDGLLRKNP